MNLPGFVRGTSGLSDVLGLEGTCCGSLGTGKKKKGNKYSNYQNFLRTDTDRKHDIKEQHMPLGPFGVTKT